MENEAEKPENKGDWRLMRQDTHGVQYFVRGNLSQAFAEAQAEKFNAKGHKQLFWAEKQPARISPE